MCTLDSNCHDFNLRCGKERYEARLCRLTSLLVQLVEELEQLRVHVVDGLEEGEHGAVVGDAAPAHVVALHAVQEGGDGVL